MSADPHAAALAAIAARRALIEASNPNLPWSTNDEFRVPEINAWVCDIEPLVAGGVYADDAALIVAAVNAFARDTDALEAVLERHRPYNADAMGHICRGCDVFCTFDCDGESPYPCPDARAALTALGVEG